MKYLWLKTIVQYQYLVRSARFLKELCMNKCMNEYFYSIKIFHGFRKNRSTQTILLQCIKDGWIQVTWESSVGLFFLDLSAAFDLICPKLLREKCKIYRISNDFLQLLESYLR